MSALPEDGLRALWPFFEPVELERGQILYAAGEEISSLYFIESGLISLVKSTKDGQCVEVGTVGYEGVAPPSGLLFFDRAEAVLDSMVQMRATAERIRRDDLMQRSAADERLAHLLHSYATASLHQMTQTAACNILHQIEQRCCRWLLIAHDSARRDSFILTHEFAMMLGVRRASVSKACEALQEAQLIRYCRGNVVVLDLGLENAACECYSTVRKYLSAVIPDPNDVVSP